MSNCICLYCENEILDGNSINLAGNMLHNHCYDLYMSEMEDSDCDEIDPSGGYEYDASDEYVEEYYDYSDISQGRYDDDPSMYDGTYSEM